MKRAIDALLRAYQLAVRPFLPPACRFAPSCSDYAREAFSRRGLLDGLRLSACRLLRCHPLSSGGWDPVP